MEQFLKHIKTSTILYFGSFNPVHQGHIAIADNVLEQTGAEALWFVVSPQNPFKESTDLAPEQHRLEMVRLSTQRARHAEQIMASGIEFEMPKPSRTIDTLRQLRRLYPQREFVLLIGSDNMDDFDKWKNYEEILDQYQVLVYPREGYLPQNQTLAARFTFLNDMPLQPYAATDIREIIAQGEDTRSELDPGVWEYIKKNKLYGYIG